MADEIKIGAEISARNKEKIQGAHDALSDLGAACKVPDEVTMIPMRSLDITDTYVNFGGGCKAVDMGSGEWHIKTPLIVFTNPDDPDLTDDYFDAKTDFDMTFPGTSTTYFNHGQDTHFKKRKLEPSTLTKDEFAVWSENILRETDEYDAFLIARGKAGKLGMSSGVPGHLVEREPVGKAMHITYWPLGKDASFTHIPAEPKTRNIVPLKSLLLIPTEKPEAAVTAALEVVTEIKSLDVPKKEPKMADQSEFEVKTLSAIESLTKAIEELKRSQPAAVSAGANVTVIKDAADQPFETAGKFFMAVKAAAINPRGEDIRLQSLKAIGLGNNETVPNEGGYLVPVDTSATIYENLSAGGEVLSRVSMDHIAGNTMVYNAIDESSRATGSRFGGVRGYWLAEAGTKIASFPKWRQVQLKLKKIAALCYATDELLEDVVALESWITRTVPKELQFMVEDSFINGDGVGKPLGIISSPALLTVARDVASQINYVDILTLWSRRYIGAKDYVWFMSPESITQLPRMLIGSYFPPYTPPGGASVAQYGTLLGRPVIETEYNPGLNSIGDVLLASMSQYQAISKGGVQSASSIHVAFTTDEQAFRFVYRVDGAPMWSSVLTPFNGSGLTVTPFVALSAATST